MKLKSILARGAAALALTSLIGAIHAGEAGSNTTVIKLMGKDKPMEALTFEGELATGESRGLYTDAGTPVTVRRTENGLSIETAEHTVQVPYPNANGLAAGGGSEVSVHGGGVHEKRVIVHGDKGATHPEGAQTHQKRVIVVKRGDAGDTDVSVDVRAGDLEDLADLEALANLHAEDADGHHKVVIVHKVEKRSGDEATSQ